MSYEAQLSFCRGLLRQFQVSTHITSAEPQALQQTDAGLRKKLGIEEITYDNWTMRLQRGLREHVIYQITDEFCCHYFVLLLPEGSQLLVAGPYVTEEIDREWVDAFCKNHHIHEDWAPVLEHHFLSVPYVHSGDILLAAVTTLGEQLWGPQNFSTEEIVGGVPEIWNPMAEAPEQELMEDVLPSIQTIEARYDAENRLIQAVTQGRSHKVKMMLSNFSQGAVEKRTGEAGRDLKNYSIILNTLMRKAVESGGVQPLYIDRQSSDFARRIEGAGSREELMNLWQEMAHKYCLLVKKHAMGGYSLLVQKVISRVDFDLTADLSLKANAEALNVNASYLSTLFKKETGVTLTDYVGKRRMEHAAFLLSTTELSVSAIGQRCGIQDDNYFTKLFKKHTGATPKQYRQELRRYPRESLNPQEPQV